MGGVCARPQEEVHPIKPSSEPSRSGKQHELPIHLLPPEAKTILANPDKPKLKKSLSDLYKMCKLEFADQLKAIGVYPVKDIWDFFEKGEVLGKGGYGEVIVVQKKSAEKLGGDSFEIKQIESCVLKFAMKTMPQIRKGLGFFCC
jgi:hypothetical protein